jgi:hypothetical protein
MGERNREFVILGLSYHYTLHISTYIIILPCENHSDTRKEHQRAAARRMSDPELDIYIYIGVLDANSDTSENGGWFFRTE